MPKIGFRVAYPEVAIMFFQQITFEKIFKYTKKNFSLISFFHFKSYSFFKIMIRLWNYINLLSIDNLLHNIHHTKISICLNHNKKKNNPSNENHVNYVKKINSFLYQDVSFGGIRYYNFDWCVNHHTISSYHFFIIQIFCWFFCFIWKKNNEVYY